MKADSQFEPTIVKFFCPRCGKEMWELVDWEQDWDRIRRWTLASLKILLVCSDCLLEEIRADREKDNVSVAKSK